VNNMHYGLFTRRSVGMAKLISRKGAKGTALA